MWSNKMVLARAKSSLLILLAGVLSACVMKPPVTSDYDASYDFSQLRTYAWLAGKSEDKVLTLDNKRDINAIETILNRKGFKKVGNAESANFLLKIHTVTDKKIDVDRFHNNWGYHPYFFPSVHPGFYGWPHSSTTIVSESEIGTLILDIVDVSKKQVIWRGSVAQRLGIYKNRSPEERSTIALTNAEAMLASFPPGKTISN